MSKKLIAVASAAALALSALVVMPTVANATSTGPFNVAATGQVTETATRDGSTSAKALEISVPTSDVLRETVPNPTGPGTGSAIKLVITTPGASDAITVTATGGVKVVTDTVFEDSPAPTSASGAQSLSDVAANGTATIYAYTTSTAVGTVVVSAAGSSRTLYIKGLSTFAYKLAFTGPSSVAPGAKATFTGTVKDMFGNDLSTALINTDLEFTAVGGNAVTAGVTGEGDFAYNATTKVYTIKHLARNTAGAYAVSLGIATAAADQVATKVDAFGDPALTAFFSLNALDPTAQIAALQAQIADMRTKANSVTKKRWNKLVRAHRALGGKAKLK